VQALELDVEMHFIGKRQISRKFYRLPSIFRVDEVVVDTPSFFLVDHNYDGIFQIL